MDDSPEITVIENQRDNLKPLLEKEGLRVQRQVASHIRELDDTNQALSELIGNLNGDIKNLSTFSRQFNSIQRDLEIAAINLNQFLTKREALRIDSAQRQTPWEILTPHETPQSSSPSVLPQLFLGGVLGMILGSAIAVIVDRMRNKVHTIRELKEVTRVPVLGTIPHSQLMEDGLSLILSRGSLNEQLAAMEGYDNRQASLSRPCLEAFRRLAANINLDGSGNRIKSLTVSSAIPNEGKSSVSFYLAYASAVLNQRTLLVDIDMRHPTLHKLCHVSNEKGLSNYIAGETRLSDSIIDLPVDDNLFLIPAGSLPRDPAKVLSSKTIEAFYQEIYEEFDLVIFDTPPLLDFADAFMLWQKLKGYC